MAGDIRHDQAVHKGVRSKMKDCLDCAESADSAFGNGCCQQCQNEKLHVDLPGRRYYGDIMAERKRCADIAYDWYYNQRAETRGGIRDAIMSDKRPDSGNMTVGGLLLDDNPHGCWGLRTIKPGTFSDDVELVKSAIQEALEEGLLGRSISGLHRALEALERIAGKEKV